MNTAEYLVKKLEAEGCEVFLPDLMGFVKYCAYNGIVKEKLMKTSKTSAFIYKEALRLFDWYGYCKYSQYESYCGR